MAKDAPNKIQIELHVPDFELAKDFYGKLGFKIIWVRQKHDAGDYMVMERDGTILNFWPGNNHIWEQSYFKRFPKDTKRGYGVEIVYTVEDINDYYDKVKTFANIVEPLKKQPWDRYDFRLEDPFGFYLRVTEPHNILDSSEAVD
jgi:lactoylglutathione lyase